MNKNLLMFATLTALILSSNAKGQQYRLSPIGGFSGSFEEDLHPYAISDANEILIQQNMTWISIRPMVIQSNGLVKVYNDFGFSSAMSSNGYLLCKSPGSPDISSPGSFEIVAPNQQVESTLPWSIIPNYSLRGCCMNGLNKSGVVVGSATSTDSQEIGVIYKNNTYNAFVLPKSTGCALTGINDNGDMVGTYYLKNDHSLYYGFVQKNSKISVVSIADCLDATPTAISNSDVVVGSTISKEGGAGLKVVGFISDATGKSSVVDYLPFAPRKFHGLALTANTQTRLYGVNNSGKIVGQFVGVYGTGANAITVYIPFLGVPVN